MNLNVGEISSKQDKLQHLQQKNNEDQAQGADVIEDLNPISLLKKPDEFRSSFYSMTCICADAFKTQNYDRSAAALNKCVDMLDLGKNILKDINKYWKIVIYGNLACSFHHTRKLQKCNKFCDKTKEEIEKIISENPEKEVYLKLSRILIRLKFQHCAILSQLQQHEKAFEMCKSSIPLIKKYVQILLGYVEQNCASDLLQKRSSETVQFSKQVYKFADGILKDLISCMNEPLKKKERTAFYYWQKNPEQNEQQVKKKFIPHSGDTNCKRSILGVSKSVHWIDEFNIGSIMHFSELLITDFDALLPMEEYLFKDKLFELVIYCSMAHFTMATELRLIEENQDKSENTSEQSSPAQSTIQEGQKNLLKKYGYQERSELFKLSQIYHLRSIDIMARNIKTTVPYISHIIKSYEKHYIKKKGLEPIAAIVEESALSINESKEDHVPKEQSIYNSYNNYLAKNNPTHPNPNHPFILDPDPNHDLLLESQKRQHQIKNQTELQTQQHHIQFEKIPQERIQEVKTPSHLIKGKERYSELKQLKNYGLQSPADEDAHNSGQYLKSQNTKIEKASKKSQSKRIEKNKSKSKHYSHSKDTLIQFHKQLSKEKIHSKKDKKIKDIIKIHTEKSEKQLVKNIKEKEKQRKTKKQKTGKQDLERYGEKQIKIKTESCTHIKVFYKKKK